MKFCKLIKYDIVNGILHKVYSYLPLFIVCVFFFVDFYLKVSYYSEYHAESTATITNFLFYFFQGKEPFTPELDNKFTIPVMWLLIFLYAAYVTLEYPFHNLMEHGTQVIIRVRSKKIWWLSKCLWVLISTCTYFAVLYLIMLILSSFFNIEISFHYADYINESIMGIQFEKTLSSVQVLMLICVLPVMTSVSINLIQLCMGLFFKQIYGFLITAILLFASSYFQSPVAIGNFAMIKRSILCNTGEMTIKQGIIVNGIIIIVSVIVGLFRIRKFDIIKIDT